MKKYIRWVGAVCSILAFAWAYQTTHRDALQSLGMAAKVMASFVVIEVWLKLKKEKQASGLTDEQFMLKRAGSASELLKQAKTLRLTAYVFIAVPIGVALLGVGRSLGVSLVMGGIIGIIFFPWAAYLFREAHKVNRVAEQAVSAQ